MAEKTYTDEQTTLLVTQYKAGETVEELALQLGKSVRSVVAKLAREGVYQKKATTAQKQTSTKKDELVLQLELFAQVELKSLQKATKEDLEKLLAFVKREG